MAVIKSLNCCQYSHNFYFPHQTNILKNIPLISVTKTPLYHFKAFPEIQVDFRVLSKAGFTLFLAYAVFASLVYTIL